MLRGMPLLMWGRKKGIMVKKRKTLCVRLREIVFEERREQFFFPDRVQSTWGGGVLSFGGEKKKVIQFDQWARAKFRRPGAVEKLRTVLKHVMKG